jgi:hypothetical protein
VDEPDRTEVISVKSKLLLGLRILLSVVVLAAAGSRSDGLGLAVQQIRIIGARQWLGLTAGSIVASVPVIAPLSNRIAGSLPTEPPSADSGT